MISDYVSWVLANIKNDAVFITNAYEGRKQLIARNRAARRVLGSAKIKKLALLNGAFIFGNKIY